MAPLHKRVTYHGTVAAGAAIRSHMCHPAALPPSALPSMVMREAGSETPRRRQFFGDGRCADPGICNCDEARENVR